MMTQQNHLGMLWLFLIQNCKIIICKLLIKVYSDLQVRYLLNLLDFFVTICLGLWIKTDSECNPNQHLHEGHTAPRLGNNYCLTLRRPPYCPQLQYDAVHILLAQLRRCGKVG